MLNFSSSKQEVMLISNIADKAISLGINRPKLELLMDIEATHCNGNPLNLNGLYNAKDSDLLHDVSGIIYNLNRKTGKLENCFSPRYSA
jgi:hypothetical protein